MEYEQGRVKVGHDQRISDQDLIRAIGKGGEFHAYLTPPAGFRPPGPAEPPLDASGADFAALGKPGEAVDIEAALVRDKVTVVDFSADWCEPCKKLAKRLVAFGRTEKRLAIRQVDVVDWDSPAAKRWLKDVPKLPYLRIYGLDHKLATTLAGDKTSAAESVIQGLLKK